MYTTRNSNKNLILNCNQNIYELWMHPLFLSYPNFLFSFYFFFFDCSCLSILWLSSHSLNYAVSHFLLLFSCVLAPWYPHHVADVIFFVIIVALYFFWIRIFFLRAIHISRCYQRCYFKSHNTDWQTASTYVSASSLPHLSMRAWMLHLVGHNWWSYDLLNTLYTKVGYYYIADHLSWFTL